VCRNVAVTVAKVFVGRADTGGEGVVVHGLPKVFVGPGVRAGAKVICSASGLILSRIRVKVDMTSWLGEGESTIQQRPGRGVDDIHKVGVHGVDPSGVGALSEQGKSGVKGMNHGKFHGERQPICDKVGDMGAQTVSRKDDVGHGCGTRVHDELDESGGVLSHGGHIVGSGFIPRSSGKGSPIHKDEIHLGHVGFVEVGSEPISKST